MGGGGSELPFVTRVTNISGTTITIADAFPATVIDGLTYFWAGGSIVLPIAQRILDYVNGLGPSRKAAPPILLTHGPIVCCWRI